MNRWPGHVQPTDGPMLPQRSICWQYLNSWIGHNWFSNNCSPNCLVTRFCEHFHVYIILCLVNLVLSGYCSVYCGASILCCRYDDLHEDNIMSKYSPENNDTLTQCWFNVGSASQTVAQHLISIGSMCRVGWGSGQTTYNHHIRFRTIINIEF